MTQTKKKETEKELKRNIQIVTNTEIHNQVQKDMMKRFGLFVTYFLFWLPKYDRWYDNKFKQLYKGCRK